jgi:hypothetical protein
MRQVLLSTVGTSLFRPNLEGLRHALTDGSVRPEYRPLAEPHAARDWDAVAAQLAERSATDRLCGAELNCVASLIDKGYVAPGCALYFFHAATEDGRAIAAVLRAYFRAAGHAPVEAVEVADLQDADPRRFRTHDPRRFQVPLHPGFRPGAVAGVECPLLDGDLAQGLDLVEHPGIHGGDEGVAADEVRLQGQDAEVQVPVRGRRRGHGGTSHENSTRDRQSTPALTARTRPPTVPGTAARRQGKGRLNCP